MFGKGNFCSHICFCSYKLFAQRLMQIQSISSTNEKKLNLSQYYQQLSENDQKNMSKIMNFIQEKPKTGIAIKSVLKYLRQKYVQGQIEKGSMDLEDIIDCLNLHKFSEGVGRLEQAPNKTDYLRKRSVQLEEINEFLEEIKNIEGSGSNDIKMRKISNLIQRMTSIQARIFLRIVVKNLRIGLSNKSIPFQAQKKQITDKPRVQHCQKQRTIMTFRNMDLMLAKPLRTIEEAWKFCQKKDKGEKILADIKYDGERTLLIYDRQIGLTMMSRRHKLQNNVYKKLASNIEKQLFSIPGLNSIQIDGEIVCIDDKNNLLPMQYVLTQRKKRQSSNETLNEDDQERQSLVVFGFDVLEYNGVDLLNSGLKTRRQKLPSTFSVKPSICRQFSYPEEKEQIIQFFLKAVSEKYEGLMIKGVMDIYSTNGSRKHWGKLKKGCKIDETDTGSIDLDLVVMGVEKGKGKKSKQFGAFLLGAYLGDRLYPITKVGSGFTDEQIEDLTKVFQKLVLAGASAEMVIPKYIRVQKYVKPVVVFKIECQNVTRSPLYELGFKEGHGGISLRFPIFESIRDDKAAQDCKADVLLELGEEI